MSKWNVQSHQGTQNGPFVAVWQGRDRIAVVDNEDMTIAHLISASPDMLATLRECITEPGAHCMVDESRNAATKCRDRLEYITSIARAAIDKAEGK